MEHNNTSMDRQMQYNSSTKTPSGVEIESLTNVKPEDQKERKFCEAQCGKGKKRYPAKVLKISGKFFFVF